MGPLSCSCALESTPDLTSASTGYHAARHIVPANIEYYDYWVGDPPSRIPGRRYERVIELIPFLARMPKNALSASLIALDRAWTKLPLARGLGWASQIVAQKPV